MYEKTKPELLDKLMKSCSISGRPSLYLQELTSIGNRIGVGEDLIRHKFIQSLPSSVSMVVASQEEIGLVQLGKLADKLMPLLGQSTVLSVPGTHNAAHTAKSPHDQKTSLPIGLRPYNDKQRQRVCRAHIYFADSAKYCKPWCRWPGKKGCKIHPSSRNASPSRSRNNSLSENM